MKHKRFLIAMIAVGAVAGWILGYFAGKAEGGVGWWGILVLLCVIFASAFLLRLTEIRRTQKDNPKKTTK